MKHRLAEEMSVKSEALSEVEDASRGRDHESVRFVDGFPAGCSFVVDLREFFRKVGAELISSDLRRAFEHELLHNRSDYFGRKCLQLVDEYRTKTGRNYPRVYKMRITVDLEELPDEKTVAFWRDRQRRSEPSE